jgi:branched-chain amino acid transport system substrate-binding protein
MKRFRYSLGFLIVVLLVGAGCATVNTSTNAKNTEPIKIGFIGPLTGDIADIGENIKAAVEIAQKEINGKGGVLDRNLEIIYEDGQCGSKQATLAGQKLINIDKVKYILSFCSDEVLAIAPIAEENKVIIIAPIATNPSITDAGDYIFRFIPSDNFQGKFSAEYIFNDLGKKNIAIVFNNDKNWSTGVKNEFEKRFKEIGGNIVIEEGVDSESRDNLSELAKIKNSDAELLYFPAYVDSSIISFRQLKQLNFNKPIFGGDSIDDASIPEKAQGAEEGVMFTLTQISELPESFKNAMKEETNSENITSYAPRSYDAVYILTDIMKKTGDDPDKVKSELYNLKDYKGIADTYTMDKNGDMVSANFVVKQFKDGKIVEVK